MEGNCSGSEPLSKQDRTPRQLVGGTRRSEQNLVVLTCCVSWTRVPLVSFVTEEFYEKNLMPTCGRAREDGQMLTLRAANGLEILYLGYLELTTEVDGVKVPRCGILFLKDTPATNKQRQRIPELLLGTNVLAQIPQFGALLRQQPNAEPRIPGRPSSGFVRVARTHPVLVPASSVASVAVTGAACRSSARLLAVCLSLEIQQRL